MKTKLFLAAIAGVALAGCVKVEMNGLEGQKAQNLVTFDSPVTSRSVSTKANVFGEIGNYTYEGSTGTYTYPKEEQFKIFAVEHSGDLTGWAVAATCDFNGQDLSYDVNVDSWAPKKNGDAYYYWPDNMKMSFAAMSPADLGTVNSAIVPAYGSNGLTVEDFTIPSDPASQFDLMFSKRAANRTAANMNHTADAYSGIPLEFQHALTSIHFSIKKDNTVIEDIVLTGIVLHNAKNKGTFNENITEGNDAAYVVGDQGNVKPAWSVVDDSKETSYQAFTGKVSFPIEAQYVSALAASDTDAADENEISHALLLMPQDLADDVVLDINYMVGNEPKTKTVQLNTYPEASPMTTWKIGYRYTYRLYYSKDTEKHDIISFGPSTSDWADGGKIEIKL